MSRAGIDSSKEAAVKLYGLWQARYPDIPISRQRCYDWLDSETANIRADRLYCLSDMFNVSARWLAKGDDSIVRWKELGILLGSCTMLERNSSKCRGLTITHGCKGHSDDRCKD